MWFDTVNFYEPALQCAVEAFGAEQILLGSDYPYFQDEYYTRSVNYVTDSRLSEKTTQYILSKNAEGLLG
jgi:aminocarboxymuconate-semialdehyde decarboxylase